jgi:hypothetical protein
VHVGNYVSFSLPYRCCSVLFPEHSRVPMVTCLHPTVFGAAISVTTMLCCVVVLLLVDTVAQMLTTRTPAGRGCTTFREAAEPGPPSAVLLAMLTHMVGTCFGGEACMSVAISRSPSEGL